MAARIRDVWASNLDVEMRTLREAVEQYPFVSMDTEFPGVVARPIGAWRTHSDYHYQTMRCNVDLLKIIQVGITLTDEEGNIPDDVCTWQFNFAFNLSEDMYSPESIDLLRESGIDFQRHLTEGIQPNDFAELLITSGLVLSDEVTWVSFHSGYDFGYLVKLLSCIPLPNSEEDFFDLFSLWFPNVYDVKYMMRNCKGLRGGLKDVAEKLDVPRIGSAHQGGSDSLLTAHVYFKMREKHRDELLPDDEYNGRLYGLGKTVQLTNGALDTQTAHGLVSYGRSAVTSAERERTPPREQISGVNPNTQSPQSAGQAGMSLGSAAGMLSATGPSPLGNQGGPGMGGGFSNALGSPYGTIPVNVNGAYHLRQIGVGGDR